MNRIPFAFDLKDGFVTIRGVAVPRRRHGRDRDDARTLLQLIPVGKRTFRIPADEVEAVEVRPALVKKCQLVVRPFSHEFMAGSPGDPDSEIALPIARKHREAAEAFAREVRLRNLPH